MEVAAVICVGVISSATQYRRTRSREKQRDVDDIIDDITLVAQAAELTGWDEWMWRTEASLALVRAVDALPTSPKRRQGPTTAARSASPNFVKAHAQLRDPGGETLTALRPLCRRGPA